MKLRRHRLRMILSLFRMNKQCFKCRMVQPLDEFYPHPAMADGHLNKCKTCAKIDVAARIKNLWHNPRWVQQERERCRLKQANYRALGLAAPSTQEARKRWRRRNPEKVKAHEMVKRAQKSGLIPKQSQCEGCGAIGVRLERHHPDYRKPLEVRWLCCGCHRFIHRKPIVATSGIEPKAAI